MATLDEQKMSGMARMMLTQGLMRGQMRGYMDGERADTHVAADSAFRFPFDPKSGGRTMTMADMMRANEDADGFPAGVTRQPKDVGLVKFLIKDRRREAHPTDPAKAAPPSRSSSRT